MVYPRHTTIITAVSYTHLGELEYKTTNDTEKVIRHFRTALQHLEKGGFDLSISKWTELVLSLIHIQNDLFAENAGVVLLEVRKGYSKAKLEIKPEHLNAGARTQDQPFDSKYFYMFGSTYYLNLYFRF